MLCRNYAADLRFYFRTIKKQVFMTQLTYNTAENFNDVQFLMKLFQNRDIEKVYNCVIIEKICLRMSSTSLCSDIRKDS